MCNVVCLGSLCVGFLCFWCYVLKAKVTAIKGKVGTFVFFLEFIYILVHAMEVATIRSESNIQFVLKMVHTVEGFVS
jgi:uncharacterized protein YhhL (DUF1145 family)